MKTKSPLPFAIATLLIGWSALIPDTCYSADRRPIAHWKFDESSGSIAHDSAGHFDGMLAGGAAFVSGGISGNCISLNVATNSLVNMGTSFPGFTSGDFSLVAWVKTVQTNVEAPLSKHDAGHINGYFLWVNGDGDGNPGPNKAGFYASDGPSQSPVSTTMVNDGQWHQLVGVYHAGAVHSIYVDGSPVEGSVTSQTIAANTAAFVVGGIGERNGNGTPESTFTGFIDDVQVYDYALSDSQIDFLFAHPGAESPAPRPRPTPYPRPSAAPSTSPAGIVNGTTW